MWKNLAPYNKIKMARSIVPYTLVGLAVLFMVLLIALPLTKDIVNFYIGSSAGFQNLTCAPYSKPCPEGYFCQQEKCTQIYPRA
jgi:hypothetical protein